jgi:hypothetical protein
MSTKQLTPKTSDLFAPKYHMKWHRSIPADLATDFFGWNYKRRHVYLPIVRAIIAVERAIELLWHDDAICGVLLLVG